MPKAHSIIGSLLVLSIFTLSSAYYVPGVAREVYTRDHPPKLQVNKLTSVNTQLPFNYYYLPFCSPPKNELHETQENLGEVLRGDKIADSVYQIVPLEEIPCRAINYLEGTTTVPGVGNSAQCSTYGRKEIQQFDSFIKDHYRVQWILDNLPAAVVRPAGWNGQFKSYEPGFKLGDVSPWGGPSRLNNHLAINILYNQPIQNEKLGAKELGIYIIGFEVTPSSRAYKKPTWTNAEKKIGDCWPFMNDYDELFLTVPAKDDDNTTIDILWTYSVTWEKSEIPWSKRWDVYLQNSGAPIHWISITCSLVLVLVLTGMVAVIMKRILPRYSQQYFSVNEGEPECKLLDGDVFRPPRHPMALAVLIGSGTQLFGATAITLLFAVVGFLSSAQRGLLVTVFLVLYVVMGFFAGYSSTRCYKIFNGTDVKKNAISTAFVFPGTTFVIYLIINMFVRGAHSSAAIPLLTILSILALWCGISVPLVFLGSYVAHRTSANVQAEPVSDDQSPHPTSNKSRRMAPFLILISGLFCFATIFIEFFFILVSLWGNHLYNLFGFLSIVFLILVIVCAEFSVVMSYYQLRSEDYNWCWRSFLTSGASAFYMLLYSVFYFSTQLDLTRFESVLLCFGYSLLMAFSFFVLTGTIGFLASLVFVRIIHSTVR